MPKSTKFTDVHHEYFKRGVPGQVFAIMCEGGGIPTVLHQTFGAAAFEAARLAHENPGYRFHVLASQRVSIADSTPAPGHSEVAVESEAA